MLLVEWAIIRDEGKGYERAQSLGPCGKINVRQNTPDITQSLNALLF